MCAVTSLGRRRRAFTLIEMLVVMGIILILATLGVAYLPKMTDSQKRTRAVDLVSQAMLTARMRAMRDHLPTGVRLLIDPNNPTLVSQLQYVQQPDPITGGQLVYVPTNSTPPAGAIADSSLPANIYVIGGICRSATVLVGSLTTVTFGNVDFTGGSADQSTRLVQGGDYLELGGGSVHYILTPPATTAAGTQVTVLGAPSLVASTTNYRIFRQPRILVGEDILQLPLDMVIDIGTDPNLNPRSHLPQRTTVTSNGGSSLVYEILFSPTGEVMGIGTSSAKILLLVRDSTVQNNPYDPAATAIVSIEPRTGLVAAQPVSPYDPTQPITLTYDPTKPINTPYANTQDARSSGM